MSEAKFLKAVEIVQNLPKDGPVKPSQDDQLFVSLPDLRAAIKKMNAGLYICDHRP